MRFGSKRRFATSTCDFPPFASRRFVQLLDFIADLDAHRVNLHQKYDYPFLSTLNNSRPKSRVKSKA